MTGRIFNTDCLEGMRSLETGTVDIIIADPPYNIGKNFGNQSDKQQMDDYLVWCEEWIAESFRVLKPRGTMFVYGFSENLAFIRTLPSVRENQVRWLIWHYTNKNVATLKFWQRSHESILCCYKKGERPLFNLDDVREPYTTAYKASAGKKRAATKGRFNTHEKETTYTVHEKGALPRDVIKTPALAGGAGKKERVDHPTQKPLSICNTLLNSCKNKDGETLLIVPFVGSGSECVAAREAEINFIGYEINPEYIAIANKRLAS